MWKVVLRETKNAPCVLPISITEYTASLKNIS